MAILSSEETGNILAAELGEKNPERVYSVAALQYSGAVVTVKSSTNYIEHYIYIYICIFVFICIIILGDVFLLGCRTTSSPIFRFVLFALKY